MVRSNFLFDVCRELGFRQGQRIGVCAIVAAGEQMPANVSMHQQLAYGSHSRCLLFVAPRTQFTGNNICAEFELFLFGFRWAVYRSPFTDVAPNLKLQMPRAMLMWSDTSLQMSRQTTEFQLSICQANSNVT